MSALTVPQVRQRVAAALEAVTDWRESRWTYDLLPLAEPGQFAHRTFAVGAPATAWDSPLESSPRRRGAEGGLVATDIRVRWLWRLRADAMVADYDAAFAGEAALYQALVHMDSTDLHLALGGMTRRPVGDGAWILGELAVTVQHRLSLG